MITIQGKIPRKVYVAVSGGVDSIATLHFLSRNHEVTAVHLNHNEGNSNDAEDCVRSTCDRLGCKLIVKRITANKPSRLSLEEFWRNQRYELFHTLPSVVITSHHLNDCVETWVWSSLHGEGKIIPYSNRNVIRPFRLTEKVSFERWAKNNSLSWVEDKSNNDLTLTRNYIRNVMMPNILVVNPGISTTIKKKVKQSYDERVCVSYNNLSLSPEVCHPS